MPQPPGIARRHRWFIGVIVVLVFAPVVLFWSPRPLPVTAIAMVLPTAVLLIWITAGPSWVWAAGPPRPADAVTQARRVGRRMMVVAFVLRLVIDLVFWVLEGREAASVSATVKTLVTGAVFAFAMGKLFEYQWSRRPADAPVPWLFRVWPLRN